MRPKAPAPDPALLAALHEAARHQQAGDLAKAAAMYRQILKRHPDHPDALHLLGMVTHLMGDTGTAVELIRRVLKRYPDFPEAHNTLGNILKDQGDTAGAAACYHKALELRPQHVSAHYNLGNCYRDTGDLEPAAACYRRAVEIDPEYAKAHNALGSVLQGQGKTEDAISCYERALAIDPEHANAQNNLASALIESERLDEAEPHLRKAIELSPRHVDAHTNLGIVLKDTGRLEEAMAEYQHALSIDPHHLGALNNLGIALRARGQLDEALTALQRGLVIEPNNAKFHNNLALVLRDLNRPDEALPHCRRAVEIAPTQPEMHCTMGTVLQTLGDLAGAEDAFLQALKLAPDLPRTHFLLGGLFKKQGHLDNAAAELRQAVQLQPDFASAHSNILFFMNYDARDTRALYDAHRAWNTQHARPLASEIEPWENDRDPDRRLKIGYVSPDFRRHSASYFFESLLEGHDGDQVEITCYADVLCPDDVTERLQGRADHWHPSVGVTDAELAHRIRADRIDILVDLAGHTGGNRLLVFARKPAPVQVSWLGYPNTTGLDTIDYRLTDAISDPEGQGDQFHSEALVRLPESFLCYRPVDDAPAVAAPPCLESGFVTFGSFNNLAKVTPEVVAAWANILLVVPDSRLLLKSKPFADKPTRERYLAMFEGHGIDAGRIDLVGWLLTSAGHLDLYGRIDIALDTFPYNGTTTTCEALCMGVPVITRSGTRHASRVGASLLSRVGLETLVQDSVQDYVDVAATLAQDADRLVKLRGELRQRLSNSPLCHPKRFASSVEAAYRAMWQEWCASDAAAPELPERVEKK